MSLDSNIKLKHIARFAYGKTLAKNPDVDNEIPAYGSNGQFDFNSYANVEPPAIIIGRKGSYGKLNWVEEPVFATDTTFFVDRRFSKSNLRWLFYALSTLELDQGTEDAAIPGLSREKAYNKRLRFLETPQQTAIADFLDRETARIDGLIQKEQRLLAMLEEKRTALISHVVTKGLRLNAELKDSGIEWVGQIPEDWVRSRLSAVCRFEQGKAHEPYVDDEGDFICVNSRFISTEGAKVKKCLKNLTPAKVNDVLMVMSDLPNGRALAKAFLVDEDNLYAVNQRVCRLRPTRIIPLYLYYLLNRNPHFLSYDDGHNQTHLPNAAFTQMPIFLPSDQQQQEIVSYLVNEEARFGALKSKITRAIGLLREKRTALISAAVTGKIEISEGSQV